MSEAYDRWDELDPRAIEDYGGIDGRRRYVYESWDTWGYEIDNKIQIVCLLK